jgi:TM2 domain-containing membrane protein YozV
MKWVSEQYTAARHFTGSNLPQNAILDIFERLYYMRALAGMTAGIVAGIVIPVEFDQYTSIAAAVLVGMIFYFVSLGIGRRIAKNVPKDKRKKIATEGIIPFIFLLLTFMIMVYTALHQSSIVT